MHTKAAELGRKEEYPFLFLPTLRIYPCIEGYYIEERYRDVAAQGKQGLPAAHIVL